MSGEVLVRAGEVAILTYHSLDESGSVLSLPPSVFAEQMRILYELGVQVVPLEVVRETVTGGGPSARMVAITFDDGFRSMYDWGFPVLRRYGFPATVFLVTDYCGRTNSWPSQPPHIGPQPLVGWTEVREMSGEGITFGSHTRRHPDLRSLTWREVEEELVASKKVIEEVVQAPVQAFAYPYGGYDGHVRMLVSRHFNLACATSLGFAGIRSDLFALPRLDVYYLRRPALFRRLFSAGMKAYLGLRRVGRALRGREVSRLSWRKDSG